MSNVHRNAEGGEQALIRYEYKPGELTELCERAMGDTRARFDAIVSDVIYVPPETPLLAAARARGHVTVNGLGMLLNQARPAFNAWFGVMPEITPELRAAIAATF